MFNLLRADFKKLLSVRSTYFISLAFLLLVGFLAFYVDGIKNAPPDTIGALGAMKTSLFIAGNLNQVANVVAVAGGLIGLLSLTHEYRYGTIVYTLSASSSRTKVLLSKIVTVFLYTLLYSVVATAVAIVLMRAGVAAGGHSLGTQNINYLTFITKSAYLCEGFALGGLLFAALIRNQVGALAALFIVPNPVEGILSLLLKHNSVYLPFTALQQVVQSPTIQGVAAAHNDGGADGVISASRGALVFLCYLFVGWLIAWYLFLHRDAT